MRIGIFSDVHGNLIALERCLSLIESEGCDCVFCLGDVVGYFPDASDCLSLLESKKVVSLLGNHDAMLVGKLPLPPSKDTVYGISTLRDVMGCDEKRLISGRVPFMDFEVEESRVLLVHGSPWDPLQGYLFEENVRDEENFPWQWKTVFMGHTHRAFIAEKKMNKIINVGSCGLPRDVGAQGSFVIFNSDLETVTLRRFDLPVDLIVQKYCNIHESVSACLYRK